MSAPIFLLSDFGLRDTYVGVMRAVIAGIAPDASVHDLVHELPPQDLAGARLQLAAALPYLPDGAVVCAVVDPGVGSERRAIALDARGPAGRRLLAVAPDNGLLSPLLLGVAGAQRRPPTPPGSAAADGTTPGGWSLRAAVALAPRGLGPDGPGTTFDGRDVFAPAAARLAVGADPATLGRRVDPTALTAVHEPLPREGTDGWRGEVVWIDRFGNLVTTLTPRHLPQEGATPQLEVAGRRVRGIATSFADVPVGAPVAYLGSLGRLEVGLRDGDAAAAWDVRPGAEVRISRAP